MVNRHPKPSHRTMSPNGRHSSHHTPDSTLLEDYDDNNHDNPTHQCKAKNYHLQNVAVGKNAYQSSVISPANLANNGAKMAVCIETTDGTCIDVSARTLLEEDPWWEVDLGDGYDVWSVQVLSDVTVSAGKTYPPTVIIRIWCYHNDNMYIVLICFKGDSLCGKDVPTNGNNTHMVLSQW
jgi:hypothetical protein